LVGKARLACCAVLLLSACGSSEEKPEAKPESAPEPSKIEEPPPPPPPLPEPKVHGPRADACKAMGADEKPVVDHSELPVDSSLTLDAGNACRLLYAADQVVTVTGPARLRVSPRGERALLLREGTLDLDFAPGAARADAAFWLATPSARVELSQGTRLLVNASASGATDLWVVSGAAHVRSMAGSDETAVPAAHGLAISPAGKAQPLTAKLDTVEEARAWMRAREKPGKPGSIASQLADFERALAALKADEAASARLSSQHQQLSQGDPRAMQLQHAIATQEAKVARVRKGVVARADALSAWLVERDFAQRAEVEAALARATEERP
jgi:hypothetical protein